MLGLPQALLRHVLPGQPMCARGISARFLLANYSPNWA
jgi:hypothetical protein